MINVYVWLPKKTQTGKNVGHASMLVGGNAYVSWWPVGGAGLGRDYHPIRGKTYASDVSDEGGNPDCTIQLLGLNERAIRDWWGGFGLVRDGVFVQGPMLPYNLIEQNCSTVVAAGLKAGGGDQHASWYASKSIIWRPQTVRDYALSIQRGLASAGG